VWAALEPVWALIGFAREYPLATLGIDEDLLKEKWAMTHPALAAQTEENA